MLYWLYDIPTLLTGALFAGDSSWSISRWWRS